MSRKSRWLSDELFGGETACDSWKINRRSVVVRAYQYWERARELLDSPCSPFALADGIANLKRSMNHRLKAIEQAYCLRGFVFPNRPMRYLEILETVGLVRPALLKYLLDVRNAIEHNDARPPSQKRCNELLDMVWYFLRSTDGITSEISDSVWFDFLGTPRCSFGVDLKFSKRPRLRIAGSFPPDAIYLTEAVNCSRVVAEKIMQKTSPAASGRLDPEVWLVGVLYPSPMAAQKILRGVLGTT